MILSFFSLGEIFMKGTIAPRDPQYAMQLLTKAAEIQEPKSIYLLGLAALSDEGQDGKTVAEGEINVYGIPYSPQTAFQTLQAASKHNSADATFQISQMLEKGVGVEADPSAAFNWLYKAARAGHSQAAYELVSKDGSSDYGGQIQLEEEEKDELLRIAIRSDNKETKSAALKILNDLNEFKAQRNDDDEVVAEERMFSFFFFFCPHLFFKPNFCFTV